MRSYSGKLTSQELNELPSFLLSHCQPLPARVVLAGPDAVLEAENEAKSVSQPQTDPPYKHLVVTPAILGVRTLDIGYSRTPTS